MALPILSGRLEEEAWLGADAWAPWLCPSLFVTLDEALPPLAFSFHVCAMWGDQVTPDKTFSI